MKRETLLLEIENAKLNNLEYLSGRGVKASIFENFSVCEQQLYLKFPPLIAAAISGHVAVIDLLVGKFKAEKTEARIQIKPMWSQR
jgi:hypothetical protein